MYKNVLMGLAIVIAMVVPLSGAATVVTLTGGCPLYVINSTHSYITFNVTNNGNGTASDLQVYATFPGINTGNATYPGITAGNAVAIIPNVEPGMTYSREFYLSKLVGRGSFAVNINATYAQAGSNYATVFPCIVYIGSLVGGPLQESVSISGNKMSVNVTNSAPQSLKAQVYAVVPPSFSVKNATMPITVVANGRAGLSFDIVSPTYTDASFPVIGELSYEYNGTHYAQMASAALVFGHGGSAKVAGGMGLVGWILVVIIVVILVWIIASLLLKRRKELGRHHHHEKTPDDVS